MCYDGTVSERRPLIGITTYLVPARFGSWDLDCALIPTDYVRGVERAGGRALLVPPTGEGVEETLDALDGIVFSGGADIDPARYGQEAAPDDVRHRARSATTTSSRCSERRSSATCRCSASAAARRC